MGAVLGGTVSAIAGGKFASGAFTGAMAAITARVVIGATIGNPQNERTRQQMTDKMNRNAPETAEEFFRRMDAVGEAGNWSFRGGLGTHNMGGASGNIDARYTGNNPGHKGWQLIYDGNGGLVGDKINWGTIDFVTPQPGNVLSVGNHFVTDAAPWVAVGNGAGDTSWIGSRLWALTKPGYAMNAGEVKHYYGIQ